MKGPVLSGLIVQTLFLVGGLVWKLRCGAHLDVFRQVNIQIGKTTL